MKKLLSLFCVIAITLAIPGTAGAKEVSREHSVANSAEANFLTSSGCEDVSVGVSVTEKESKVNNGEKTSTNVLSVFGSFVDICEFGTSTSFFGTTTVVAGEFVQHGTDDATLNKTFSVGGNEIHISLTWKGVGVIGGEDSKIHDKDGDTKIKKKFEVDSRNAEMTGVFEVNGLNRISDSSLVNAQLEVVKTNLKTVIK